MLLHVHIRPVGLRIAIPVVIGGNVNKGEMGEGDMECEVSHPGIGACLNAARYLIMLRTVSYTHLTLPTNREV